MSATSRTRYRPGLTDILRREWYMARLDWGLRNLPSRESRRIQSDLRRDVTATAADIGMRPALADLGASAALAERYTAGIDPAGPRYGSGAVAAGVTVGVLALLFLAYAIGTLDTLLAMGGGTRTANIWGSETVFVSTTGATSFEIINVVPMLAVILGLAALVFLLVSRIWRLLRRSA